MADKEIPKVEFAKVTNSRIDENGSEIWLVCESPQGEEFNMLIPTDQVPSLTNDMNAAFAAARIRQTDPQRVPVRVPRFMDAPPVFIMTGLGGTVYPDSGRIDLQIRDQAGQEFVVGMPPEFARQLFEFLLQAYGMDDQKPS